MTITGDSGSVTYIKGAPERILDRCKTYIDENGQKKPLTEMNYLVAYIDKQAGRSMRLLAVWPLPPLK